MLGLDQRKRKIGKPHPLPQKPFPSDKCIVLPGDSYLKEGQSEVRVPSLEVLFTDPGMAQWLLARSQNPSDLGPSGPPISPLLAHVCHGNRWFQVHWVLARAQTAFQIRNRQAALLGHLTKKLGKRVTEPVALRLANQTFQTFLPFFREIRLETPLSGVAPPDWTPTLSIPLSGAGSQMAWWDRLLELSFLLAQDWDGEHSYLGSFETAWPLIRDLGLPSPARIFDELLEIRENLPDGTLPKTTWKPLEWTWFLKGAQRALPTNPEPLKRSASPSPQTPPLKLITSLVREELAEMAAGAGHEINNPLGILTGTIQKLHKDLMKLGLETQTAPLLESLEVMKRQVGRVRHQIEDLMAFARPPAPRPQSIAKEDLRRDLLEIHQDAGLQAAEPDGPTEKPARKPAKGTAAHVTTDSQLIQKVGRWVTSYIASQWQAAGPRIVRFHLESKKDSLQLLWEFPLAPPRPSQIVHLFTPFFCSKPFARSSGLHLAATRAVLENMGGTIQILPAQARGWTRIVVEVPTNNGQKQGETNRKAKKKPKVDVFQAYRPVA